MSDCIYGAFGKALEVRGLGPQRQKDQIPKFKTAFYQHSAPTGQNSGGLQWYTPSYLMSVPEKGFSPSLCPRFCPRNGSC
jgi:hypothetical protein